MSYGVHPDCRIYWANPLSYITRAILINEFTASKHITLQHCVAAQCSTATKSPNFYQTCCSGHNFPSCHSSLSLHGTECLTCKGFANVMMMQFAIADHVATHACTYMPQPITILVQSAVWLQITGRTSCTHTAQHKLWVMASWAPLAYPPTTTGAGLPLASALPTSCYSMSSLSSCSPSCHVSLCSPLPCQWLCSEC